MVLSLVVLNRLLLVIVAMALFLAAVLLVVKWKKKVMAENLIKAEIQQATGTASNESETNNVQIKNREPGKDVEIEEGASMTDEIEEYK